MDVSTVTIFGAEWKIFKNIPPEEDVVFEGDCGGYCDESSKSIFLRKYTDRELAGIKDYAAMEKYVLRHELIHAALLECGLGSNWCRADTGHDETAVDWLAHKFVQLYQIFEQAGAI